MQATFRTGAVAVACALALGSTVSPAAAQSVVDRSPNLSGGWVAAPGVIQFNFLHRFTSSDAPQRKVTSSPSFHLGVGLPAGVMLGTKYATHSTVAPALPNEWEFFGRWAALTEAGGSPVDVAIEGGYNLGAESVDGELNVARRIGPLRVLAAARAMTNAYAGETVRYAVGGGASLRLLDGLALAGDVASLLDRQEGERVAWGAAVQIAIPYTPHSLSLQVTNVNTATIEGTSVGTGQVRWGFEFTIPVTLRRYLPRSEPEPPVAGAETDVSAFAAADTVVVAMEQLAYSRGRIEISPGTTVVWTNEDPVIHTVTADDGSWDSGEVEPGRSWSRTFDDPGEYPYHCTPHPFMTATVVVTR